MKRLNTILTICVLFLLSFNVNGQILSGGKNCDVFDVEIVITDIIWNATPADMVQHGGKAPGPAVGFNAYPPVFHIAEIDFNRPPNFVQQAEWMAFHTIDIDISTANYDTDVPVYLVFRDDLNAGVVPFINGNGDITGFRIFPGGNGGGVSSTLGILGRSAGYTPDPNWDCIEIVATHRVGKGKNGRICHLDDDAYDFCEPIYVGDSNPPVYSKVDMTDSPKVNVYPNPVQNNLFIENNGLEINEINIMTLDGQVINHKASIRQGIDKTQINTSQLDTGIYLLKLETPTESIIKKILVQ